MQFNGTIQKLELITKRENESDRDYIRIAVLVPIDTKTNMADFARLYRSTALFEVVHSLDRTSSGSRLNLIP